MNTLKILKNKKINKKFCYYAIKKEIPKIEVKPKVTGFIHEAQQKGK